MRNASCFSSRRPSRRRARVVFLVCACLVLVGPVRLWAADRSGLDGVLSAWYGTRIGLSLLFAGTAATDPEASAGERALLGGTALAIGIPSTMVLIQKRRQNAGALRVWRYTAFGLDLGMAASLIGYGAWLIGGPDSSLSGQYSGLACLIFGLMGAGAAGLDLVPFGLERPMHRERPALPRAGRNR